MVDSAAQRANMVATQLRTNDVTDQRLCRAVLEIPRENFVPSKLKALAYLEDCIPLGKGRVLLDPRCFGKLAQLAEVEPNDSVLDVACGTGYSTAVIARIASRVLGLEEDRDLAQSAVENLRTVKNADVVCSRLTEGYPGRAPYDVIFVNGAVERAPDALLAQLGDEGRLVCIFRDSVAGHARLYVKHDGAISERDAFDAHVPVLPGFEKARRFAL